MMLTVVLPGGCEVVEDALVRCVGVSVRSWLASSMFSSKPEQRRLSVNTCVCVCMCVRHMCMCVCTCMYV